MFVLSDGSNQTPSVDTSLSYNPSTNNFTVDSVTSAKHISSSSGIITDSSTSRSLGASDNGAIIQFTSSLPVSVTVPTGLNVGFTVTIIQAGSGQITFTTSSTTLNNRQGHSKTSGQWAVVSLIQRTSNNFVLAGDTSS